MENVRRRHNYLPFIMELLKTLANKGDLVPLAEKVKVLFVLDYTRIVQYTFTRSERLRQTRIDEI